jgi:hypothetical protein
MTEFLRNAMIDHAEEINDGKVAAFALRLNPGASLEAPQLCAAADQLKTIFPLAEETAVQVTLDGFRLWIAYRDANVMARERDHMEYVLNTLNPRLKLSRHTR